MMQRQTYDPIRETSRHGGGWREKAHDVTRIAPAVGGRSASAASERVTGLRNERLAQIKPVRCGRPSSTVATILQRLGCHRNDDISGLVFAKVFISQPRWHAYECEFTAIVVLWYPSTQTSIGITMGISTDTPFGTYHCCRSKPPCLSGSPGAIRAEWLPNCIARFFLPLASTKPSFRAANLNSSFSPTPASSLGSTFKCTGSCARNETTDNDRNGCRVSFPREEITLSSRPKFRRGILSSSS